VKGAESTPDLNNCDTASTMRHRGAPGAREQLILLYQSSRRGRRGHADEEETEGGEEERRREVASKGSNAQPQGKVRASHMSQRSLLLCIHTQERRKIMAKGEAKEIRES